MPTQLTRKEKEAELNEVAKTNKFFGAVAINFVTSELKKWEVAMGKDASTPVMNKKAKVTSPAEGSGKRKSAGKATKV